MGVKNLTKKWNIFVIIIMLISIVLPIKAVTAATTASDLFFSEYAEGSSNNKALEIYNGTGQAVNLSQYTIELYANGATASTSKLTLPDYSLQNGATYVIVNSSANADFKAKASFINSTVTAFNGDDAVVLKKGTSVVDSIGKVGEQPTGGFWGTADVKTKDQTLVRKISVTTGDVNTSDVYETVTQWDAQPIDTFTNLGTHTMEGGSTPVETKVANVVASVPSQEVEAGTTVTLTTETASARIYYTVDGTDPTEDSTEYLEPIVINENTTIKAIAIKAGAIDSDIVTFTYTVLVEVLPPVEAPAGTKVYNLVGFHTNKLTVKNEAADITIDETSVILQGMVLESVYAKVTGEGLKNMTVVLNPATEGAIFDFGGIEVKKVVIDSENISEIRGIENVQEWGVTDGVNTSNVKFVNVNGVILTSPFVNEAPVVTQAFLNRNVQVGTAVSIDLNSHFSDPEGAALTYTTNSGSIQGSILTILTPVAGSFIVTLTATDGVNTTNASFILTVANPQPGTDQYYANAIGKTGPELKAALHNIIKGHTQLSYDQVTQALKDTDEDPNNKNNVILLYTNRSQAKTTFGSSGDAWNREHVWAKSHGDFGTSRGPGTDIHHLRPTDASVNSSRGHLDFDNGGSAHNECTECKYDGDSWEPPNRVKGDIARMLMYMAVRYEGGGEIDLELADKVNTYPTPFHGKLSVLLEWNKLDPVDAFEIRRNNIIQTYQKNRNPFVDHPEWADLIWSN
jgi:endonuclease I